MPRTNHGFTLIDMLLALMVAGFIMTLMTDLFEDPLLESRHKADAAKVIAALRTVQEAVALYKPKSRCAEELDVTPNCMTQISDDNALLTSGVLTTLPRLPERIFVDGGPFGDPGNPGAGFGVFYPHGYTYSSVAAADWWGADKTVVYLILTSKARRGITEPVCKQFNAQLGYGAIVVDPGVGQIVDASKGAQCVVKTGNNWLLAAGDHLVVWPLYSY